MDARTASAIGCSSATSPGEADEHLVGEIGHVDDE